MKTYVYCTSLGYTLIPADDFGRAQGAIMSNAEGLEHYLSREELYIRLRKDGDAQLLTTPYDDLYEVRIQTNNQTKEKDKIVKTYVHSSIIGYRILQAETATKAWAEVMCEEIYLKDYIDGKEDLRIRLLEEGYTQLLTTSYDDLYEVIK